MTSAPLNLVSTQRDACRQQPGAEIEDLQASRRWRAGACAPSARWRRRACVAARGPSHATAARSRRRRTSHRHAVAAPRGREARRTPPDAVAAPPHQKRTRQSTKCEPTFWSQLTQHGLWGSVRQPATAGRARVGQRKRLGLWLIIISCRFSRFSRRRRARRRARQPFCFGFGLLLASSAGILLSGQPWAALWML